MNWASEIQAVLFDFDDTLMQTKKIRINAIKMLGERYYDFIVDDALIDKHWGIPFFQFYQNVFQSVDDDLERILERRDKVTEEYPNQPYHDAKDVLIYLAKKYQVGVVTAASKSAVDAELNGVDLPIDDLTFIQTAEDTFYHKPNPKVFDPSIERLSGLNIVRNQILYVGDSLMDFNAANNAGLNFVGIANNTTPEKEFSKVNAAYISRLSELITIL